MQKSPIWEVIKATVRYLILWLPVVLEAMGQFETGGLVAVISVALTALDKGIHESRSTELKGLLPF